MRLPRDLSGAELVRRLRRLGYEASRQTGSHIRLTSGVRGEHHVTVPKHDPLRVGTLSGLLASVASHHGMSRDQLLQVLFE